MEIHSLKHVMLIREKVHCFGRYHLMFYAKFENNGSRWVQRAITQKAQ